MLSMHSLHSLVIVASWHCLVPLVSGQTEPWMRTPPPPPMPPGATADSFVRQSWMSDDYGYSRYGGEDLRYGVVCDRSAPGSDTNIVMRWNMYAGGAGQYEVAGCEGVSPTLRLRTFTTYKFVQNDTSNWYHPIGFSFEPGGDHNDCPINTDPNLRRGGIQVQGLECRDKVVSCQMWAREGQCEMEKSREFMHRECRESCNMCQCPELQADMVSYFLDGRPIRDDLSTFGRDAYEPFFRYPEDIWYERCSNGTKILFMMDYNEDGRVDFEEIRYFAEKYDIRFGRKDNDNVFNQPFTLRHEDVLRQMLDEAVGARDGRLFEEQLKLDEVAAGKNPYKRFNQDWRFLIERGPRSACFSELNVNRTDIRQIYYFCRNHKRMSAVIEIVGADANGFMPAYPQLLEVPQQLAEFDKQCGTYDHDGWLNHSACRDQSWLCMDYGYGESAAWESTFVNNSFHQCLSAIACKNKHDKAVHTDNSSIITFMRQMIPQAETAASMAKTLLKHCEWTGAEAEWFRLGLEEWRPREGCDAPNRESYEAVAAMARETVNVMNTQITFMETYLLKREAECHRSWRGDDGWGGDNFTLCSGRYCYNESGWNIDNSYKNRWEQDWGHWKGNYPPPPPRMECNMAAAQTAAIFGAALLWIPCGMFIMYYCIIRRPHLVDNAPEAWQYPSWLETKIRWFFGMHDGFPDGDPPTPASKRVGVYNKREVFAKPSESDSDAPDMPGGRKPAPVPASGRRRSARGGSEPSSEAGDVGVSMGHMEWSS